MKITFRVDCTSEETSQATQDECPQVTDIVMTFDLSADSRHTAIADVFERFLRAMGYHIKDGIYRGGE